MASVNVKDVLAIMAQREHVGAALAGAVERWQGPIEAETSLFSECRAADADAWAQLCVVKAILSPGAQLDRNIRAAHAVYARLAAGDVPTCFDDVKAYIDGTMYGTRCYGNNVRALLASWQTLRTLRAEDMTWDGLTALVNAGALAGLGEKTRSWALALYDADSAVFTLDRHMLRGICACAGVVKAGEATITGAAYVALAEFMLALCADVAPNVAPLVVQWGMWNDIRHPGQHASHAALAA